MGLNRCMLVISAGGVISVMLVTEKKKEKSLGNSKAPVFGRKVFAPCIFTS